MTIVKELNDLAEKMTGVRPKATTDAQAMDYIEQHYTGGGVEMPTASADTLGGVKVGTNLSIDANGVLSATDTTYTAGDNITITNNVISASGGGSSVTKIDLSSINNLDNMLESSIDMTNPSSTLSNQFKAYMTAFASGNEEVILAYTGFGGQAIRWKPTKISYSPDIDGGFVNFTFNMSGEGALWERRITYNQGDELGEQDEELMITDTILVDPFA